MPILFHIWRHPAMKTQTIFLGHVFPYIIPEETYSLIIAIQKQSATALHICHCVKIYTKCLCEVICNIAIIDSHTCHIMQMYYVFRQIVFSPYNQSLPVQLFLRHPQHERQLMNHGQHLRQQRPLCR